MSASQLAFLCSEELHTLSSIPVYCHRENQEFANKHTDPSLLRKQLKALQLCFVSKVDSAFRGQNILPLRLKHQKEKMTL